LKVAQVLPALHSGGVERGTLEIANALVQAKHQSLVISAGGRLVEELEAAGSRHLQWSLGKKSLHTLGQVRKFRRWLQEEQPDIVHVRSRMPAWIVWLAWRKIDPRNRPHLVTTLHGLHSVNRYSGIMGCGEKVIVVSETARDYLLSNYPQTDPSKIVRIYRGVDPQSYNPHFKPTKDWLKAWRELYPGLEGKYVITLPGRMTRLKGHSDFIDLIGALKKCGHNVTGLIVGGIDPAHKAYHRELEEKAANLGLDDDIVFAGHRDDLREIIKVSSLVVSLSNKPESFGRTVLEALTLGCPVIGYDHGGVGEVLGKLFPAGKVPLSDLVALTERVETQIENPDATAELGDSFTLETMCRQTLGVYRDLVAQ